MVHLPILVTNLAGGSVSEMQRSYTPTLFLFFFNFNGILRGPAPLPDAVGKKQLVVEELALPCAGT